MFKQWRKRRKCDHEFHHIGEFRRWEGSEYVEYISIYCPKCDYETYCTHGYFRKYQKKKRVREEYRRTKHV